MDVSKSYMRILSGGRIISERQTRDMSPFQKAKIDSQTERQIEK